MWESMWLQPLFIFIIIIIIKRLIKEIYRHKLHQFAMQINQSDVMILNRGVTLNIRWKSNKRSCFSHHKCLLAYMICLPAQVIEMKKKLRFKCGDLLLQSYRRECWANPEHQTTSNPQTLNMTSDLCASMTSDLHVLCSERASLRTDE